MLELQSNGVEIYQFPVDDESVAEVNAGMNSHIPFAVVGSTDLVKIGNKTVRARQYPWGTVQGGCGGRGGGRRRPPPSDAGSLQWRTRRTATS